MASQPRVRPGAPDNTGAEGADSVDQNSGTTGIWICIVHTCMYWTLTVPKESLVRMQRIRVSQSQIEVEFFCTKPNVSDAYIWHWYAQ
jgi:hypothetical protein